MSKNSLAEAYAHRMTQLRRHLADSDIDLAVITDDDCVYYFTGYYDYRAASIKQGTLILLNLA